MTVASVSTIASNNAMLNSCFEVHALFQLQIKSTAEISLKNFACLLVYCAQLTHPMFQTQLINDINQLSTNNQLIIEKVMTNK